MPRVSAPLVLLPTWLVMVACSPHSLRIGKSCSRGALGAAQLWLMPRPVAQVSTGDICSCTVPSLSLAGLAVVVVVTDPAVNLSSPLVRRVKTLSPCHSSGWTWPGTLRASCQVKKEGGNGCGNSKSRAGD